MMSKSIKGASLVAIALLAACSRPQEVASPTSPVPPGQSGPAPLIGRLPAGCNPEVPTAGATVTFVSGGRAWAVSPQGKSLTCLFETDSKTGPFRWGPKGDRILLPGLEVKGVGAPVARPPTEASSASHVAWGRPTGNSFVFTGSDARIINKVSLETGRQSDLAPVPGGTYKDVAYHPSGRAIAFIAETAGKDSIWISSNNGSSVRRLVFSEGGTKFKSLAFSDLGDLLYYGATHEGGSHLLHSFSLKTQEPRVDDFPVSGPPSRILVPPAEQKGQGTHALAVETGTGCGDRRASYFDFGSEKRFNTALLPSATEPTFPVGWIDPHQVLVGEGGCEEKFDLWIVSLKGDRALVARDVTQAAARLQDSGPPPPMPEVGVEPAGFG